MMAVLWMWAGVVALCLSMCWPWLHPPLIASHLETVWSWMVVQSSPHLVLRPSTVSLWLVRTMTSPSEPIHAMDHWLEIPAPCTILNYQVTLLWVNLCKPCLTTLGNVTSCSALYMYHSVDGSLNAIEITWTPILVCNIGGKCWPRREVYGDIALCSYNLAKI